MIGGVVTFTVDTFCVAFRRLSLAVLFAGLMAGRAFDASELTATIARRVSPSLTTMALCWLLELFVQRFPSDHEMSNRFMSMDQCVNGHGAFCKVDKEDRVM